MIKAKKFLDKKIIKKINEKIENLTTCISSNTDVRQDMLME